MWTESFIVATPDLGIGSLVLDCCSTECWEEAATTTAFGLGGSLWLVSGVRTMDCDAAMLFEVQSFLSCRARRSPVPLPLQFAWEVFYRRHEALVRREVRRCCRVVPSAVVMDDLAQESWRAIVTQLCNWPHDRIQFSVECWLKGLVRRTVWRHWRSLAPLWTACFTPIDATAGVFSRLQTRGRKQSIPFRSSVGNGKLFSANCASEPRPKTMNCFGDDLLSVRATTKLRWPCL